MHKVSGQEMASPMRPRLSNAFVSNPQMAQVSAALQCRFFKSLTFETVENPRVATNFLVFPSSHGFSPAEKFSFAVLTLNKRNRFVKETRFVCTTVVIYWKISTICYDATMNGCYCITDIAVVRS